MAYVPGNLSELVSAIGGKNRVWLLITADSLSTVVGAGYISDAGKKRMLVGDTVLVLSGTLNTQLSTSPTTVSDGTVSEFSADPSAAWMQVASLTGQPGATTTTATLRQFSSGFPASTLTFNTTVSNAAGGTLNSRKGVLTTDSLTTAGQSTWTGTLTNSFVTVGDHILATISGGTNTAGAPALQALATAGAISFKLVNAALTAGAYNGTFKISFTQDTPS